MATTTPLLDCVALYPYTPSLPLATVAICVYTMLIAVHTARTFLTRASDNIFLVLGGICELAGHTARLYSSQDVCNKSANGIQSILLRLGPTLMMVTITLTQTVFISTLAPEFTWVPIRVQRHLYFTVNTIIAIVQTTGSIILVSTASIPLIKNADKVIVASFVAQIFFWAFLLAENIYFSLKLRHHLKSDPGAELARALSDNFAHWQRWNQLFGLAIAIIAFGRNLVRLTEMGGVEFLRVNEWPSYAFDSYQMVVVMGAWAVWFLPGECKKKGSVRAESSASKPENQG